MDQPINGKILPIAYASRKLNPSKTHYSTSQKEALGCLFGVTHFKFHLIGQNLILITSLKHDFEVNYKPGIKNRADALFINVQGVDTTDENVEPFTLGNIHEQTAILISPKENVAIKTTGNSKHESNQKASRRIFRFFSDNTRHREKLGR